MAGSGGLRALCEGMIARAPGAAWAHRRLGMLQLQEGEAEASVASLQKALRADASSAEAWEVRFRGCEGLGGGEGG